MEEHGTKEVEDKGERRVDGELYEDQITKIKEREERGRAKQRRKKGGRV